MKRSEIFVSASLVPIDYLMVFLAGLSAYFIRYLGLVRDIRPIIFDLPFGVFIAFLLLVSLIYLFAFAFAGLYSMKGTRRTIDELSNIVLGCSMAVMVLMFVFFFSRQLFDSRFIILAGWIISIIYVFIGRGIVRFIQHYFYRFGFGIHRVIVIGDGYLSKNIISEFKKNLKLGFRVDKIFSDFSKEVEEKLNKLIKDDKFDEILVANSNLSANQISRLNDFSYVNHVVLKFVADIFDFPITNFQIDTIANLPVVEVKKTKLDGWGRIYKRAFDIIVSSVVIILLLPVFLIVAIAVKADSKGPVFFVYKRIGAFGNPFVYFKFRSMIDNAHKYRFDKEFLKKQKDARKGSPLMKFEDDPRVTRVGRFIRRMSIDELPELFNVFIGNMSMVGPRPHEIQEVEKYKTHHKKVLTIRPGITGMAQVSGRSDLDFEEEIRLDTWYVENWSLRLDLMILLKTPWAVLKDRKAE